MGKQERWQLEAKRAFARKVAATPSRVLRDRLLREYFLVDFFHDAVFRKISFDHSGRTVEMEVLNDGKIIPKYNKSWGIRLPEYKESPDYYAWRLRFSEVAHFSLKAVLTSVVQQNGKIKKENWAFHEWLGSFEYIGGRFLNSKLLQHSEKNFKKNLLHLRMDCHVRIIDLVFESVRLKRLGKVPHRYRQPKEFRKHLRST